MSLSGQKRNKKPFVKFEILIFDFEQKSSFMGTFYNNANCDIYIGKGAGKKLMEDIQNARKSIKIICPYLSPFLIKELIHSRNRGLDIQLITVDGIEDYKDSSNIYQLIKQYRHTDEEAQRKRDKWKKIANLLLIGIILLTIITFALFIYLRNTDILWAIIPILILSFIFYLYKNSIKKKRIFSYSYSQLFPFKVYISPEKHPHSDTFIHGKVYIIDDSIVYLGSLNFTASGTKHNYETRVRTTDYEAVKKIRDEFYSLFHHSQIPEIDIQSWGRSIYPEPIN